MRETETRVLPAGAYEGEMFDGKHLDRGGESEGERVCERESERG